MTGTVDILMISFRRPEYLRLALPRLLETCDERSRVWLWHNGTDERTLEVVHEYLRHPHVHAFQHSPENVGLREPTNWLWSSADGDYVSKVDDDCLVPHGWVQTLRQAHEDHDRFGAIACWRFYDEDFVPEHAHPRIGRYPGGHRMMRNLWVQGSGYLLPRRVVRDQGLLRPGQSFTQYCIEVARSGRENGWYYPFLPEEHMDDPRSPHSLLRADGDLERYLPLSARQTGVRSLAQWTDQMRRSAVVAQTASLDPRHYAGWRLRRRNLARRLQRLTTGRAGW